VVLVTGCTDDSTEPKTAPPPVADSHEWPVSAPADQGLDASILSGAITEAQRLGFMDGLVVIRNGHIVAERYFNGFDDTTGHNVKSVSKSFLSALVGIALEEGYVDSLDQKIAPLFQNEITGTSDSRLDDITLRHLLTMRAGFDTDRNTYLDIYYSPNWIEATLGRPLIDDPGAAFHYSTFSTHILAVALSRLTGKTALEYGKQRLFDRLHMTCQRWDSDPQGNHFGGNEMYFTPRDAARLGYLYLHGGVFNGENVLPRGWAETSVANSAGGDWSWGDMSEMGYGSLWWTGTLGGYSFYCALGHGGQYILVFPEAEMIVVTNSFSNLGFDDADVQERAVATLVKDHILAAIL
jgi:CubicO group peptidase (beta-lactamase class C family)